MQRTPPLLFALCLSLAGCNDSSPDEADQDPNSQESSGSQASAPLWNGENPVPFMGVLRAPDWTLLEQLGKAGGMELEVPEFGFPQALIAGAENTRTRGRDTFKQMLAQIETEAKPVFLFGDWLKNLPDDAEMEGMLQGLQELIAEESWGESRVIVVESVPRHHGVYYFDMAQDKEVKLEPDELAKRRDAFFPKIKAIKGVEIAPFATVFDQVGKNFPAWQFDMEDAWDEAAALWAAVVFCTITRVEPPLEKLQEQLAAWDYWKGIDGFRPKTFTDLPPETLKELSAFILAAVQKAN